MKILKIAADWFKKAKLEVKVDDAAEPITEIRISLSERRDGLDWRARERVEGLLRDGWHLYEDLATGDVIVYDPKASAHN